MGILSAGRPSKRTQEHVEKVMKTFEKDKRLNIKIKERDYDKLKTYCFKRKISISDYVRQIIFSHIEKDEG